MRQGHDARLQGAGYLTGVAFAGQCIPAAAARFARAGQPDCARDILAELERRESSARISPVSLAQIHISPGETDRAITLLEQAVDERVRGVLGVAQSPFFDSLRTDPRLKKLVAQTALPVPR